MRTLVKGALTDFSAALASGDVVLVIRDVGLSTEEGGYVAYEDFAGPAGATGATGPAGAAGPAGAQGPAGPASYTTQGAWATSTAYVANDLVTHQGRVWNCILDHTSGASTEPGVGGSYATNWEVFLELPNNSVTNIISPGATWAPTLINGAHYYVELDQNLAITLGSAPGANESIQVLLSIKTNGFTVTWADATPADTVVLSAAATVVDHLVAHNDNLNSVAQGWRVVQYDQVGSAAALPSSGLTHVWDFITDANDSEGSDNWTLVNGAAIAGSAPNGLALDLGSSQYAHLAVDGIDWDADFTAFICLSDISVATAGQKTILSAGRASGGIYVALWSLASGNLEWHIDQPGVDTPSAIITVGNLPASQGLYMLRRNGTTMTLTCLTNSATASSTVTTTTINTEKLALGARYKGGAYDQHWTGTVLALATYNRAVTDAGELANIRAYYQARGLSV